MENHGLGSHNDKMCVGGLTGNTQNTPQFIRPICLNQPIIWDIVKRCPSYVHAQIHIGRNVSIPFDLYIFLVSKYFCLNQTQNYSYSYKNRNCKNSAWATFCEKKEFASKYTV